MIVSSFFRIKRITNTKILQNKFWSQGHKYLVVFSQVTFKIWSKVVEAWELYKVSEKGGVVEAANKIEDSILDVDPEDEEQEEL